MNYSTYKVISDQYFSIFGGYSFTTNPIVNSVDYSASGISTSKYTNLPGKETSNFGIYMNAGRKIQSVGINVGFNMNSNGSVYYNYVNGVLNMTKNYTFNPGLSISKYQEKKIDIGLFGGPTYTVGESSLQPNVNNNGWGAHGNLDATIYLPLKFQIGTNSEYQYNGKTESFNQDFSRTLVNVFLIKTFLKQD